VISFVGGTKKLLYSTKIKELFQKTSKKFVLFIIIE